MTFVFTIDTLISLLALLLSISAGIYTWYSNRYSVEITSTELIQEFDTIFIKFKVVNTSQKPIKITGVTLSKNHKIIENNSLDIDALNDNIRAYEEEIWNKEHTQTVGNFSFITHPYMHQIYGSSLEEPYNFDHEFLLLPNESTYYSYYVDKVPNKIKITANKNIGFLKKSKSFFALFVDQ